MKNKKKILILIISIILVSLFLFFPSSGKNKADIKDEKVKSSEKVENLKEELKKAIDNKNQEKADDIKKHIAEDYRKDINSNSAIVYECNKKIGNVTNLILEFYPDKTLNVTQKRDGYSDIIDKTHYEYKNDKVVFRYNGEKYIGHFQDESLVIEGIWYITSDESKYDKYTFERRYENL